MIRCEWCSNEFVPYSARNRFCCRACSDAWFANERREAVEAHRQQRQAEGSTYFSFAANDPEARAHVIGSTAEPPPFPAPSYSPDPGTEPPLGINIDEIGEALGGAGGQR